MLEPARTMYTPDLELVDDSASSAHQGRAIVLQSSGEGYVLDEGAEGPALRAASCLLRPEVGDRVWFVAQGGETYILAVLVRAAQTPAQLGVDGDAVLRVEGQLEISAGESLDLHSEGPLALRSDELRVRTRVARIFMDECSAVLRSLFTHLSKSTIVAKVVETFAARVSVHSKSSSRVTEGVDQVHAGVLERRAEKAIHLESELTMVKGGELVKVDGGQIHVG